MPTSDPPPTTGHEASVRAPMCGACDAAGGAASGLPEGTQVAPSIAS